MPLPTTYSALQTWLATFVRRTDLTADIDAIIREAEAKMRSDRRLRLFVDLGAFAVVSGDETTSLPSDFAELNDATHVGSTYYGPINVVPHHELGHLFATFGATGAPVGVAIVGTGTADYSLKWAPVPDADFTINLAYWAKLTHLSVSAPTNRWLTQYPHLYRYACMSVLAEFLKEDERLANAVQQYDRAADMIYEDNQDALYGGTLSRVPGRVF